MPLAHAQVVNPNLAGTTSYDGWNDLSLYAYPGFPSFPGLSNWPRPMDSRAPGSGDAEMTRLAIAADGTGGGYPAEESLYFFSFAQVPNALGGTLRVEDRTPVANVRTVVFQIEIGEIEGYDFVSPAGFPTLKINGQSTGLASLTPVQLNRYQNGTYFSPETEQEEPVYITTWGFQWDTSNLGAINSIQIDFSVVTHAQIYSMRLDQSTQAYASSVFDGGGTTETRVIELSGNLAFGNLVVGQSDTRTLTINNTGNAPLTVSSISFPSPVFSGDWSGTIPAGSSQNVTITFQPTAATSYSGSLTVNSNSTGGTNTAAISGTGVNATRVIEVLGALAFGNVEVGQTAQRDMTIRNTGNSVLNVSSITYPAGFSGSWNGGAINPGSQRIVTVTFAPTAAISYGGTITVDSDRTSGTNTISTSGTGTAAPAPVIQLSGNLSFASVPVGASASQTLTISNTGNASLNVTAISYPLGFSGDWSSGLIAAGGQRQVQVTFTPTRTGAFTGSVSVTSNAASGGNAVSVSGSGTSPILRPQASGVPEFNGASTTVTHRFNSTPNTWLHIQYTDNLGAPDSWVLHPAPVDSGPGEFDVTFSRPGDHRAAWLRGMYFRLLY